MWPFSYIKSRLVALVQHNVRVELNQHSVNYQAAKNLIEVLEMQLARLETDVVRRLDDIEERLQAIEQKQPTDEN